MKSPWLVYTPRPGRRLRLYCLPYAGGAAHVYSAWQAQFPSDVEVVAVQLPGRASRMAEAPLALMDQVVTQLAAVLREEDAPRFAFFGHSLGALVAFELARYMSVRAMRQPEHLFVSACNPPQARATPRMLCRLPDTELISALGDYAGTPSEILQHRELMDLLLPTLRADFQLAEEYVYSPGLPLETPITVLCGQQDPYVDIGTSHIWQRETVGSCTTELFNGEHFFLNSARESVLASIRRQLRVPQDMRLLA